MMEAWAHPRSSPVALVPWRLSSGKFLVTYFFQAELLHPPPPPTSCGIQFIFGNVKKKKKLVFNYNHI